MNMQWYIARARNHDREQGLLIQALLPWTSQTLFSIFQKRYFIYQSNKIWASWPLWTYMLCWDVHCKKKKKEENFKWNMLLFIIFTKLSDTANNHITDIPSPWNSRLLRAALLCEEFCEDILLGTFCKT